MHAPYSPAAAGFRVELEPDREAVRVRPIGELDVATVDDVRARIQELAEAGFRRVVLDLREVTFLDSTTLCMILEARAASDMDGWELGVIAGPPEVQRVFELAGVQALIPFVDPRTLRAKVDAA
jgi:anti-sigma B factor antagonist